MNFWPAAQAGEPPFACGCCYFCENSSLRVSSAHRPVMEDTHCANRVRAQDEIDGSDRSARRRVRSRKGSCTSSLVRDEVFQLVHRFTYPRSQQFSLFLLATSISHYVLHPEGRIGEKCAYMCKCLLFRARIQHLATATGTANKLLVECVVYKLERPCGAARSTRRRIGNETRSAKSRRMPALARNARTVKNSTTPPPAMFHPHAIFTRQRATSVIIQCIMYMWYVRQNARSLP